MTFAEEIKAARKALKMTHHEFSKILDVSISSIQKWEYGLSEPLEVTKEGIRKRLELTK
jgi:DNA-binding transcriptional regulator YiaG